MNTISYSLWINGKPADPSPSLTVRVGDKITISVPDWPGWWLTKDLYRSGAEQSHTQTPYSDNGTTLIVIDLPVGKHAYRVGIADGSEYFGFQVIVPGAQADAATLTSINKIRIETAVNATGATWQHVPSGDWSYAVEIAQGGSLTGATIATVPRANLAKPNLIEGINVTGKGSKLDRITLADGSGWGVKVRADDVRIDNLIGFTFTDYLIYGEGCKNLIVNGVKCRGGSTAESIIRMAGATGELNGLDLEYSTTTRKACLRGNFVGKIGKGIAKGAIVGLNPLNGGDGGQSLLLTKFLTAAGFVDVLDSNKAMAAVRAAVKSGQTDSLKIGRIAADAGGLKVTDWEIASTAARRAEQLAEYSDVEWSEFQALSGIRFDAGTKYVFNGGKVGAADDGNLFIDPRVQYPEVDYVLPADKVRSTPDITFNGTELDGAWNIPAAWAPFVRRINCTGKGIA